MLHDYANICLLVVFFPFFNFPPYRPLFCWRKVWMSLDSRIGIGCNGHNREGFLMDQLFLPNFQIHSASLFADSTFPKFSLVLGETFHSIPDKIIYMLLLRLLSQRSNIFNNKTNTWFCPAASRMEEKLFPVQQKKRKQKPREASKANDFCFEKTSHPTQGCFLVNAHCNCWVFVELFPNSRHLAAVCLVRCMAGTINYARIHLLA